MRCRDLPNETAVFVHVPSFEVIAEKEQKQFVKDVLDCIASVMK